jgi:hypothetical protein
MKKHMFIIIYGLTLIACVIGAIAITQMRADDKLEDVKITMQAEIDKSKIEYVKLDEFTSNLAQSNVDLRNENTRLTEEIETLNDVIVRMRTAPEANKLLKERLPYGMTNTLRFMDYRKITDKNSIQYRLQEDCDTDVDSGIRVFYANGTDYYCAALGSAYGRDIGDTWHVTLACGAEFDIILADFKDDGATDYFGQPDKNYDGDPCTSVIEFVTDEDYMPSSVLSAGTYTVFGSLGGLHGKGGNIIEMKYLGRVWE